MESAYHKEITKRKKWKKKLKGEQEQKNYEQLGSSGFFLIARCPLLLLAVVAPFWYIL